MKAVAVSLFSLAVLMVFAAVKVVIDSDSWSGRIGALVLLAIVIYMFLRVARDFRELELPKRESASDL